MPHPSLPQILDAARAWHQAGVAPLQIRPGGSKRPPVEWKQYIATAPTVEEVQDWFGNGRPWGLALIMGAVSGNVEMTELEAAVTQDPQLMERIFDQLDQQQAWDVWDKVYYGYHETSPAGGLHLIYRITDHAVPGNEKIARRPTDQPNKVQVLAETRGEGGYVIVAPTSGMCHPSGKAWVLQYGEAGVIPEVTWTERNLLHSVLRDALDSMPAAVAAPVVVSPAPSAVGGPSTGLRPGDDFEARTSWDEILAPHGWTALSRFADGEVHWVRPGKSARDGMSATTGHASDRDRLYVFSTSTVFPTEVPLTKFRALSILEYRGDDSAAARALAARGYGSRPEPRLNADEVMDAGVTSTEIATIDDTPNRPRKLYSQDDDGNARRLWDATEGRLHYVKETKGFRHWDADKARWVDGDTFAVQTMMDLKDSMIAEAKADADEAALKWARKLGFMERKTATLKTVQHLAGVTVSTAAFDPESTYLNVTNGVLNYATGELLPHDPKFMMTRMMGAAFDPSASCPEFEEFMARVVPDAGMRRYVQRAVGYSLLGTADQRAMFLIHGPSGTGKSTFMETIATVFGEYAGTAPAGTLKVKQNGAPSNDLHALRGKRFVSTSETSESAIFDEDMIKRLTGRDKVQSRALYQDYQEWVPECSLWLATNHPPRFTPDDTAIWRRAKLIPFVTELCGDGEVFDMARKVLVKEANGILNWILAGLSDFLANGLGEPEEVRQAAKDQQAASDPVARFLEDQIEGELLELGPAEFRLRASEVHQMFIAWARNSGERAMTIRRFNLRVKDGGLKGISTTMSGGYLYWVGVKRRQGAWITGALPGS